MQEPNESDRSSEPPGDGPRLHSERAPASRQSAMRNYSGEPVTYTTGDVVLLHGKGFSSWVIRWSTNSTYSHAGLIYVWNGPAPRDGRLGRDATVARVYVLEARGKEGVRLVPLSLLAHDKHYAKIHHYELTQIRPEQREDTIRFVFPQLGKLYDRWAIWRFAVNLLPVVIARMPWVPPTVKQKRVQKQEARRKNEQFFCSELVAAAFEYAGLTVPWETELISPENLRKLRPSEGAAPYLKEGRSIRG